MYLDQFLDDREKFFTSRNVVVFQHFKTEANTIELLKQCILPGGEAILPRFNNAVQQNFRNALEKFMDPDVAKHIKVIYLFITEGYYNALLGNIAGGIYEVRIMQAATAFLPDLIREFPATQLIVRPIGLQDLQLLLASVQTLDNRPLRDFLLDPSGKGGYDTPKIAAALIKLARLPFERSEMIIQIDDDVRPNATGILNLKERYYELMYQGGNRPFCMSWNYNASRIEDGLDPLLGPNYDALFGYLVNSFSIRVTFMAEPGVRCQLINDNNIEFSDPDDKVVALDIVRTKYFLEFFRMGIWGSGLNDPISGAGMVYSSASLKVLPPWTNATELISWIDDFIKWQLMEEYYEKNFRSDIGLLIHESGRGFPQDRNQPSNFKIEDVKWSVNTYLDRLLMGCLLCFAVKPGRYNPLIREGFGSLLRENNYTLVKMRWKELRKDIKTGMTEHITKVLKDWLHYFCHQAVSEGPGYITDPPRQPDGFTKSPADTPFNTYSIKQMIRLKADQSEPLQKERFDLVEKVLVVLDRYLELKYEFWPQLVRQIERIQVNYLSSIPSPQPSAPPSDGGIGKAYDWLFEGLSSVKPTAPMPTRKSVASYALIKNPSAPAGKPMWLVQWNAKWKKMNLISGHQEPDDPNPLACIVREVHEELFKSLNTEELKKMRNALKNKTEYTRACDSAEWNDSWIQYVKKRDTIKYVEFSGSAKEWTDYEMTVFDVELKPSNNSQPLKLFIDDPFFSASARTSPKSVNEWISQDDVRNGNSKLSRPISDTLNRILKECKLI